MIAQTLKHLNFFLLKNTIKACDFKVEALVTALMTLCGIHSVVCCACCQRSFGHGVFFSVVQKKHSSVTEFFHEIYVFVKVMKTRGK